MMCRRRTNSRSSPIRANSTAVRPLLMRARLASVKRGERPSRKTPIARSGVDALIRAVRRLLNSSDRAPKPRATQIEHDVATHMQLACARDCHHWRPLLN